MEETIIMGTTVPFLALAKEEQVTTLVVSGYQTAFASIDGEYQCPLCEKTYTDTPQGEYFLKKHMQEKHGTII